MYMLSYIYILHLTQFVQDHYAAGLRYRKRVDEINEFARFHRLPKSVVKQIRQYNDFAFAVRRDSRPPLRVHNPPSLTLDVS